MRLYFCALFSLASSDILFVLLSVSAELFSCVVELPDGLFDELLDFDELPELLPDE